MACSDVELSFPIRRGGGPRTPEGKARVRLNGLSHGLTAKDVVLHNESAEEYETLRSGMLAALAPADALEEVLADRVIHQAWRIRRAARAEKQLLDGYQGIRYFAPFHNPNLGEMFAADFANGEQIARIERHATAAERSFMRNWHELQRVQAARLGLSVAVVPAVDVDVAIGVGGSCGEK